MKITLSYYALLREQAGQNREQRDVSSQTVRELYSELQKVYDFTPSTEHLRAAVNNDFVEFDHTLEEGDHVVFIPPVAGG